MNPNFRSKPFKINANIHSLDGRLRLLGAASSHPIASDAFPLPAGTMPREYDPIVAAYQEMVTAYEAQQAWFDGPVTPQHQAQHSEARFTPDDGIDAVVFDDLHSLHEIQDAIDLVKGPDNLPKFAREFVDDSVPEPDSAEPFADMDSLTMPTEFDVPRDETPEPQPPVSTEGFSPLEQIVQAEMIEQALQQENAATPPQPEDPEEQLRRQQELDQLLNPYNALLFNPFGMPGPS
jgi:hypothetical protein